MTKKKPGISRRNVLKSAAATAIFAGGAGPAFADTGNPWSARPGDTVDELSLVVWTYGKVYDEIVKGFTDEWQVPLELISSPYPQHEAKLATVYAGGDSIDVAVSASTSFSQKIAQGLVRPLDDLEGADFYRGEMTPRALAACTHDGKLYALPYFSGVWMWGYNDLLLKKAGLEQPFSSYEELVEHALKAKKDGIAEYPILWTLPKGDGTQATWFSIVHDQGGKPFDEQGRPLLDEGTAGREVLRWLGDTFTKHNISDPESLKMGTGQASQAFGGGNNLYRGPDHHYMMHHVNVAGRTAISGHFKAHRHPASGRSLTLTQPYFISTATRNPEWAWKLLQYVGGRTPDGEYRQATNLAKNAMLGSGYKSVMTNPETLETWNQWADASVVTSAFEAATDIHSVMPLDKPWFENWRKQSSIDAHKVFIGEQSADAACDNMIAKYEEVSRI